MPPAPPQPAETASLRADAVSFQPAEADSDVRIYTSSRVRRLTAARRRAETRRDAEAPAAPADFPAPPPTAARQLGLDITTPWPGSAEDLRRLFATQAPAEDAPRDGFTYVRAPMPEGSGYNESLAGLKAEDGRVTGLRYALPGRRAPEPPAGLDGYQWIAADGENGYWVSE